MDITRLKTGTRLELEIFDKDGERLDHTFVSQFDSVRDDGTIIIAAPIHEGVIFPIHIGSVLNVYFNNKERDLFNQFKFRARVNGRGISQNIPLLKLEAESEIEKIQRRQFYRFECSVPIRYKVVTSLNPEFNENVAFQRTFTKDLSGCGLCIMLEERIERDSLVECELILDTETPIKFFGRVIRIVKYDTEGKFKYEAGVLYKKIRNIERERIIKFIFEEQRKLRKKG